MCRDLSFAIGKQMNAAVNRYNTKLTSACSKSTIEKLEKSVKCIQS